MYPNLDRGLIFFSSHSPPLNLFWEKKLAYISLRTVNSLPSSAIHGSGKTALNKGAADEHFDLRDRSLLAMKSMPWR